MVKQLVILGAGTGGTIMANKLQKKLHKDEWNITIIDRAKTHFYQPGFLYLPFGMYREEQIRKPSSACLSKEVKFLVAETEKIHPADNTVVLADGTKLSYDFLIIATGTRIVPSETPGMEDVLWRKKIFDFYTFEGATALSSALKDFQGGELVINLADMPIKCPVAPLEFAMLADAYFSGKGIRDKIKISYVTPLSGAFTKPGAAKVLGALLEKKNI
ncbi:MAG: FAD-dependent oxidoreductase, partial [Syntrophothermus sp.]